MKLLRIVVIILCVVGLWLTKHLLINRWGQDAPIKDAKITSEALQLLETLPTDPVYISDKDINKLMKLDELDQNIILNIYKDNPTVNVAEMRSLLNSDANVKMSTDIIALATRCLEILESIPQRRLNTAKRVEQANQNRID